MIELIYLTKRNIKSFTRDKTAVFFSFLSIIILLGLYLLFLKNMYIADELREIMSSKEIDFLSNTLIMCGVLVINTFTLSLGNLGNVINDFTYGQINGFIVTPVKRYKIIFAYYLSSLLITIIFTIAMWLLAVVVIGLFSSTWYPIYKILVVCLYLIIYTFISTAFMVFITTFIKSVNAFGVLSGILGTVIGFTSGIYMPLEILPDFIQQLSSLIPFTHMTIHLKQFLLKDVFIELETRLPAEAHQALKNAYGLNPAKVFNTEVNIIWILIISCLISLLLLLLSSYRLSKRIVK